MDFEQVCGVRVCFKKLNVIIRVNGSNPQDYAGRVTNRTSTVSSIDNDYFL